MVVLDRREDDDAVKSTAMLCCAVQPTSPCPSSNLIHLHLTYLHSLLSFYSLKALSHLGDRKAFRRGCTPGPRGLLGVRTPGRSAQGRNTPWCPTSV